MTGTTTISIVNVAVPISDFSAMPMLPFGSSTSSVLHPERHVASAAPAGIHTLLLRTPLFIIFACFSLSHPRNQLHLRNTQPTQLNAYAAGFYERRFRRNLILAKESTDDVSFCVHASAGHAGGHNVSSWKMTCSRRLELIRQVM